MTWGPSPATPPAPARIGKGRGCTGCLGTVAAALFAIFVVFPLAASLLSGGVSLPSLPSASGTVWLTRLVIVVVAFVLGAGLYALRTQIGRYTWAVLPLVLLSAWLMWWPSLIAVALGLGAAWAWEASKPVADKLVASENPYKAVREYAATAAGGGGAFVGFTPDTNQWVAAEPQDAVLVVGPPRQGKTANILIPSLLVAPGAVVSTSVKDDVMQATFRARQLQGTTWLCDPTGEHPLPPAVRELRWSPVCAAGTWDGAMLVAESMVAATPAGSGPGAGDHFMTKAKDVLAPLLYAASLGGRDILAVSTWVLRLLDSNIVDEIGLILDLAEHDGDEGAKIANDVLAGIVTTADKERSSIVSTAASVMRVYTTMGARKMGTDPNFDVDAFVRTEDTIYITAPADRQALYAPVLVALLEQIRYATYRRRAAENRAEEARRPHVTFVLDEVTNTAPVPLASIASEAGGQSLHIIAALQDLSQARKQWGSDAADGFFTLFRRKVILGGIGDPATLDALSKQVGEYDRLQIAHSHTQTPIPRFFRKPEVQHSVSTSTSYVRQAILTPGDIANLPEGQMLFFAAGRWELVKAAPYYSAEPWRGALAWVQQGRGKPELAPRPGAKRVSRTRTPTNLERLLAQAEAEAARQRNTSEVLTRPAGRFDTLPDADDPVGSFEDFRLDSLPEHPVARETPRLDSLPLFNDDPEEPEEPVALEVPPAEKPAPTPRKKAVARKPLDDEPTTSAEVFPPESPPTGPRLRLVDPLPQGDEPEKAS